MSFFLNISYFHFISSYFQIITINKFIILIFIINNLQYSFIIKFFFAKITCQNNFISFVIIFKNIFYINYKKRYKIILKTMCI